VEGFTPQNKGENLPIIWKLPDGDVLILPSIYPCSLSYETGMHRLSAKTISIRWFDASWQTVAEKVYKREKCMGTKGLRQASAKPTTFTGLGTPALPHPQT
jgi:hypothetical protein